MTTTGPITIATDSLFTSPQFPRIARRLAELLPVGLRDQLRAARADLETRLREVLDEDPELRSAAALFPAECPAWLRLGALDALVTWAYGHCTTCRHAPTPLQPKPVTAAAWRPGLIVCGACTHLLRLPRGQEQDRTCDACGRVVDGLDADDMMYPGQIVLGLLIYVFGTCRDCRPMKGIDL